jgi:hypothetical protein
MSTRDILFWIFAAIQSYMIFYISSKILIIEYLTINQAYGLDTALSIVPEIMLEANFMSIPLIISIIGIEYLIYSQTKQKK